MLGAGYGPRLANKRFVNGSLPIHITASDLRTSFKLCAQEVK